MDLQPAIDALNTAYEADPQAVHALLCNSVPCNQTLADHPTVEVGVAYPAGDGAYRLSALGFLNGALMALTGQRIASNWSDEADEDGRRRLLGFILYTPPEE